ncbi:CDP-alcohol phosphatidyltransferase family protein [Pseudolysinimonas sp.]|uniref:CDP-alcohol phosphatidyltransferase family protein n=1 Tax=Pseudolysinimonas sp. TaxID=2680009 RepID=UPI00286B76A1|nr:CDP-alcohol phosphatidyltransferase family protein [Pseudolysinimonas sp.]
MQHNDAAPPVSSRIVTIPNILSLFRLLLIPVFLVHLVLGHLGWALLVIAVSAITDFVDGYIARHFNQISRLGQLLDPAADRLFILATLLGLAYVGVLPWWLVAVIIARDLLLLVLGVVLASHRFGPLPVHHLGKMGTFAILFAMPVLLAAAAFPDVAAVALPLGWAAAIWGVFLYWWAGIAYILQAGRMIREVLVAPASASDTVDR